MVFWSYKCIEFLFVSYNVCHIHENMIMLYHFSCTLLANCTPKIAFHKHSQLTLKCTSVNVNKLYQFYLIFILRLRKFEFCVESVTEKSTFENLKSKWPKLSWEQKNVRLKSLFCQQPAAIISPSIIQLSFPTLWVFINLCFHSAVPFWKRAFSHARNPHVEQRKLKKISHILVPSRTT